MVRIPLPPLVDDIRLRHGLTEDLFETKLDGDNLVLFFKRPLDRVKDAPDPQASETSLSPLLHETIRSQQSETISKERITTAKKRRRASRRNRMKTRGWQIVSKLVNSKGQTAVVYKPFVEALFGKSLTPVQQRSKVAEILRSNGNVPTEASIEYFLTNTLEYLAQVNKPEAGE